MQEPKVKQVGNVYVYEEPYRIDYVEWSHLHPNTVVAYMRDDESSIISDIYAYCSEKNGRELHDMFGGDKNYRISFSLEIDPDNLFGGAYGVI